MNLRYIVTRSNSVIGGRPERPQLVPIRIATSLRHKFTAASAIRGKVKAMISVVNLHSLRDPTDFKNGKLFTVAHIVEGDGRLSSR